MGKVTDRSKVRLTPRLRRSLGMPRPGADDIIAGLDESTGPMPLPGGPMEAEQTHRAARWGQLTPEQQQHLGGMYEPSRVTGSLRFHPMEPGEPGGAQPPSGRRSYLNPALQASKSRRRGDAVKRGQLTTTEAELGERDDLSPDQLWWLRQLPEGWRNEYSKGETDWRELQRRHRQVRQVEERVKSLKRSGKANPRGLKRLQDQLGELLPQGEKLPTGPTPDQIQAGKNRTALKTYEPMIPPELQSTFEAAADELGEDFTSLLLSWVDDYHRLKREHGGIGEDADDAAVRARNAAMLNLYRPVVPEEYHATLEKAAESLGSAFESLLPRWVDDLNVSRGVSGGAGQPAPLAKAEAKEIAGEIAVLIRERAELKSDKIAQRLAPEGRLDEIEQRLTELRERRKALLTGKQEKAPPSAAAEPEGFAPPPAEKAEPAQKPSDHYLWSTGDRLGAWMNESGAMRIAYDDEGNPYWMLPDGRWVDADGREFQGGTE